MKSKKGVVEAQLTWVFILIVGTIILLFFIGIAQKQRQIAEMKSSANILQQLDGILTGAEVSSGTSFLIKIPKVEIELDCNSFSIGGLTKSLKTRIVFSPDLISGRQLIIYNLDWSVPYRVSNFLYLSSPEVRYVLVGGAEELNESLPEFMNKEIVSSIDNLTDKNNYKVKFVFFDYTPSGTEGITNLKTKDVTAISIDTAKGLDAYGTIEFYQVEDGQWSIGTETDYLKKESVVGAIFAENIDQYECAMKKASKKLKIVTSIHKTRATTLSNNYDPGSTCYTLLNQALNLLREDAGLEDTSSLVGLVSINRQLQLLGCPTIY